MPERNQQARAVHKAQIHGENAVVPHVHATEVLYPGDRALDFPAFAVAPQLAFVFVLPQHAIAAVGGNQVDAATTESQPHRVPVEVSPLLQLAQQLPPCFPKPPAPANAASAASRSRRWDTAPACRASVHPNAATTECPPHRPDSPPTDGHDHRAAAVAREKISRCASSRWCVSSCP